MVVSGWTVNIIRIEGVRSVVELLGVWFCSLVGAHLVRVFPSTDVDILLEEVVASIHVLPISNLNSINF